MRFNQRDINWDYFSGSRVNEAGLGRNVALQMLLDCNSHALSQLTRLARVDVSCRPTTYGGRQIADLCSVVTPLYPLKYESIWTDKGIQYVQILGLSLLFLTGPTDTLNCSLNP